MSFVAVGLFPKKLQIMQVINSSAICCMFNAVFYLTFRFLHWIAKH